MRDGTSTPDVPTDVAFEVQRAVADADLADLDRPARLRLVGIRRPRLDQLREVPAVGRPLEPEHRLVEADVVEHDVAAENVNTL